MDALKLSKVKLGELLEAVMSEAKLIAPVKLDEGVYRFREIEQASQVATELGNTNKPPKEVFLPQTDLLFKFKKEGKEYTIEQPPLPVEPKVLFGARPCDVAANRMIDPVYRETFEDSLYAARRDNTLIIAVWENCPQLGCFCESVQQVMSNPRGMDVLFTDLGDAYYVEAKTEPGEEFLGRHKALFEAASAEDKAARDAYVAGVIEKQQVAVDVEGHAVHDKLDKLFDDDCWDEIAESCLGCGICTYLCPTCHCFDIEDDGTEQQGVRYRTWDTCQFPHFTLETSGHNPRPSRTERVRQRVMHKFKYFVDRLDVTACVGCGRCVRYCPVNIDIREIINKVKARSLEEAQVD